MNRTFKFFREKPDGSYCIGDSEVRLTVEQFRKLQALMPQVGWLGFYYPRPEDILNDAYKPSEDHAEFLKNYEKDKSKFLTLNKPKNNGNID